MLNPQCLLCLVSFLKHAKLILPLLLFSKKFTKKKTVFEVSLSNTHAQCTHVYGKSQKMSLRFK